MGLLNVQLLSKEAKKFIRGHGLMIEAIKTLFRRGLDQEPKKLLELQKGPWQ